MPESSFWSRIKNTHLFRVLVIYLAVSWVILQVVQLFIGSMGLPEWAMPGAVVLLLIGLVVVLATAWIGRTSERDRAFDHESSAVRSLGCRRLVRL